jgi:hypothetical protein
MMDSEIMKGISGKTGADMWLQIDDLVVRWAKRNPFGANWNRIYNENRREDLKDQKFALSYDKKTGVGSRTAISVHPELVSYIETFFPKFFEKKENVRIFGNKYKMFKIPESQL